MNAKSIFKRGSKTFYYSSLFFPRKELADVTKLYAFVRLPDNYVDRIPQQPEKFYAFKNNYKKAFSGKVDDKVIDDFVELQKQKGFKQEWVDAYLDAMESDLRENTIWTIEDMLNYVHGSAEVVGLMMNKLLGMSDDLEEYAILQARAYQLINFIRDVDEDLKFGRTYFPGKELKQYGLFPFTEDTVRDNPEGFNEMMRFQISRFRDWLKQAETGVNQLPFRYRAAIQTASAMYRWTADKIEKDPMIVFSSKVKPSRFRVIAGGIVSTVKEFFRRS